MKTFLFLVVLCCSVLVSAQTPDSPGKSGNDFVRLCSAIDKDHADTLEYVNAIHCQGYITGFLEGVSFGTAFKRGKGPVPDPYCVPGTVELNQLIRVVVKYIHDNPENADSTTGVLIIGALEKAFPCRNK